MTNIERPVWDAYRPSRDPYVGAKVLEALPFLLGPKGDFIVGLFAYLRWVDDEADENNQLSRVQKLNFLYRQMALATGTPPSTYTPMEEVLCNLPWKHVPEQAIRPLIKVVIGSMLDDTEHQGFIPRTDRELKHYSIRAFAPVVDILFLAINNKLPHLNGSLMKFLDAYTRVGSLEGLGDDLNQGVLKLALPGVVDTTCVETILEKCDQKYFDQQKWANLKIVAENTSAFWALDIPLWQKVACVAYAGEVLVKKSLVVNRTRALKKLQLNH